jgi:hypothetical protein
LIPFPGKCSQRQKKNHSGEDGQILTKIHFQISFLKHTSLSIALGPGGAVNYLIQRLI